MQVFAILLFVTVTIAAGLELYRLLGETARLFRVKLYNDMLWHIVGVSALAAAYSMAVQICLYFGR